MTDNDIVRILTNLIEESIAYSGDTAWDKGEFVRIRELQSDNRGDVGEKFIAEALIAIGHKADISSVTDPAKKHWDVLVDNKIKLEIKTATLGRGKTFQHENIEKDKDFHALVLLDIAPNELYLTCAAKSTLPWTERNSTWTNTSKKMHRRRISSVYKWDLNLADVVDRKIQSLDDIAEAYSHMLATLDAYNQVNYDSKLI